MINTTNLGDNMFIYKIKLYPTRLIAHLIRFDAGSGTVMADGAVGFDLVLTFAQGVALVAVGFAFAKADLDFHQAVLQVELQRDNGVAFFFDLLGEFEYLAAVQQQFPDAYRGMVENAAVRVCGDVDVV